MSKPDYLLDLQTGRILRYRSRWIEWLIRQGRVIAVWTREEAEDDG